MAQIPQKRISLSKIEAARSQLETAINLYFNGGDPVSTHTLASAVLEVIRDLNKACNGTPMFSDLEACGVIRPDKLELARRAFRGAQNFFKHADKDPNALLDFNSEATAFYLFDAVEKYRELSGKHPPIIRVFALWFRVQWTELFHFANGEDAGLRVIRLIYTLNRKQEFFTEYLPRYVAEATKVASE